MRSPLRVYVQIGQENNFKQLFIVLFLYILYGFGSILCKTSNFTVKLKLTFSKLLRNCSVSSLERGKEAVSAIFNC